MVFAYSPDIVLRSFTVPIALENLPEDWAIADALPMDAQVDLSGSERSFQELDTETLTISIDLSRPTRGTRDVVIGENNLVLPSGVTLRRVRPAILPVQLMPTRTVRVPVVVPTIGTLPETLELVSLRAEPDSTNLIVPEGTAGPDQVPTEALDLRQIIGDSETRRPLAIPPDSHLPSNASSEVMVRVNVRARSGTSPRTR
jgi:YbbR domain-containing protein